MSAVTDESFEKVKNRTVLRQDDIQSLVATPPIKSMNVKKFYGELKL